MKQFFNIILLLLGMTLTGCDSLYDDTSTLLGAASKNLEAYYTFTGNADDSSGNENHGIDSNVILTTDRYGQSESAYEFNGSDSYVQAYTTELTGDFSISLWFNVYSKYSNRVLVSKGGSSVSMSDFTFIKTVDEQMQFAFGQSDFTVSGSAGSVDELTWVHGAVTFSDDVYSIYINGKKLAMGIMDPQGRMTSTSSILIGALSSNNNVFDGKIDDVRVYSRALSSTEVKTLYDAEKP